MEALTTALPLFLLYLPSTLLINRLWLAVRPGRRLLPGQGTIAGSAAAALLAALAAAALLLDGGAGGRLVWLVWLGIVLGCQMLVYISVMCVSESGRRFYLLNLIASRGGIPEEDLKAAYGREHMLAVRLERLRVWGVLIQQGGRYRLARKSAYYYSRFFQLWGRLLGFDWMR